MLSLVPGEGVVQTDGVVAFGEQMLAKVTAEEAGVAGDQAHFQPAARTVQRLQQRLERPIATGCAPTRQQHPMERGFVETIPSGTDIKRATSALWRRKHDLRTTLSIDSESPRSNS